MPRFVPSVQARQPAASSGNYLVYVGTYTSRGANPTGSSGIYVYRFKSKSGEVESLGVAAESQQPSFLAVDPARKYLYAVDQTDTFQGQPSGGVRSFSIDLTSGKLSFLNELASPTHITVEHTGKYVIVSNYNSGSLAVFPALADGRLGDSTAFDQHQGSSVNPRRQAGPHVHEAILSPDNRFILSTDLGLDKIFVYPFDAKSGTLGAQPHVVEVTPGIGPRHMAFSANGKFVYAISEMGSTITMLSYDPAGGNLTVKRTVPLAPETDTPAQKSGAEIAAGASGQFLYASNRSDTLMGVYSIDQKSGAIKRIDSVPLNGKNPRDFSIDPSGN